MPALLRGMINDGKSPDGGGKFLRGMLTSVSAQNDPMGYSQIPVKNIGSFSVLQVNNNPNQPAIWSAITMTDSGLVTSGSENVQVVSGDVIIWTPFFFPDGELDPNGWNWVNHGQITLSPNIFFHIRITDKTPEEVSVYLESLTKKVTYESLQYDPQTNMRRVRVTNLYVTASGNNGFTDEGSQAVVDEWNGTRVSWSIYEIVLDAELPPEVFEEFQESVNQLAFGDLYSRRRWYITNEGMTSLENNDYVLNGTASEVAPFLRDGLLD